MKIRGELPCCRVKNAYHNGVYKRSSDGQTIRRFRCKTCQMAFWNHHFANHPAVNAGQFRSKAARPRGCQWRSWENCAVFVTSPYQLRCRCPGTHRLPAAERLIFCCRGRLRNQRNWTKSPLLSERRWTGSLEFWPSAPSLIHCGLGWSIPLVLLMCCPWLLAFECCVLKISDCDLFVWNTDTALKYVLKQE